MKESLTLPHGYTANIDNDDFPENPWESWDGQPPILVFHDSSLTTYKDSLSLRDIYREIPVRCFGPKGRQPILDAMGIEPGDAHRYLGDRGKAKAEDWYNAIAEILPENPGGWTSATKFFEMLEFLCTLAKIPCKWARSNGYSQGHASLVFVAAMPQWVKEVGWNPPKADQQESLQADIDLYSAWAWGDVYGVKEILRPDSTEVPDSSCWGFYGTDHTKSGLMEHCNDCVEYDLRYLAKESAAAFEAACRGILTTV